MKIRVIDYHEQQQRYARGMIRITLLLALFAMGGISAKEAKREHAKIAAETEGEL